MKRGLGCETRSLKFVKVTRIVVEEVRSVVQNVVGVDDYIASTISLELCRRKVAPGLDKLVTGLDGSNGQIRNAEFDSGTGFAVAVARLVEVATGHTVI
jgi:hypothetical protein